MKQLLLALLCLSTIISCKKNNTSDNIDDLKDQEEFTASEIQMLDYATRLNLKMSDVVLPNGMIASKFLPVTDTTFFNKWLARQLSDDVDEITPLDANNLLIKKLSVVALNLVDRNKHQFKDEGENKPAQNGIAYSYGSRDFNVRQKPKFSKCTNLVYGLDCSGMLSYIFKNSGVNNFPLTAQAQRQPSLIQKALNASFPQLKRLKVEDLKRLDQSKFRTGDIIYWIGDPSTLKNPDDPSTGTATHIGLVLKTSNDQLAVFQSNGRIGSTDDECEKNRSKTRGPGAILMNNSYWFGPKAKYGVVRFNLEISGKWDFHFKCTDQTAEAFVLNLDFPPSENKQFTIDKDFIDYDGSTNHAKLNFTYDNLNGELLCDYTMTDDGIPGFERKDSFAIDLQLSNSKFIAGSNIYIHNGTGCALAAKLVSKN